MSFWFFPVTRLAKWESWMEGSECKYRERFV